MVGSFFVLSTSSPSVSPLAQRRPAGYQVYRTPHFPPCHLVIGGDGFHLDGPARPQIGVVNPLLQSWGWGSSTRVVGLAALRPGRRDRGELWQWGGVPMVIYGAGLNRYRSEAARRRQVEGHRFRPCVRGTAFACDGHRGHHLLTFVTAFQSFAVVYV